MFPRLENYPQLYAWFNQYRHAPPDDINLAQRFLWSVCRSLAQTDPNVGLRLWMNSVRQFFKDSSSPSTSFLEVEEFFTESGIDFMKVSSEIADYAIQVEQGEEFHKLMSNIGDLSDLSVFRFLAAWTALNTDQLEVCIKECEKISDPFACVFTLQGQAQLELGMVQEAVDSLKLAVELNPEEVLTHFQLAKAYHVIDQHDAAWQHLEICEELSPRHPEIDAFKAMVALATPNSHQAHAWLDHVVPKLIKHVRLEPQNLELVNLTMDAVFHRRSQSFFEDLLNAADWPWLKRNAGFLVHLPKVLKNLDACGWKESSIKLLSQLTESNASNS